MREDVKMKGTHPGRSQEHSLRYMVGGGSDHAESYSREDVRVVPLPGPELLAVVLNRRERGPGCEYTTTLDY